MKYFSLVSALLSLIYFQTDEYLTTRI